MPKYHIALPISKTSCKWKEITLKTEMQSSNKGTHVTILTINVTF